MRISMLFPDNWDEMRPEIAGFLVREFQLAVPNNYALERNGDMETQQWKIGLALIVVGAGAGVFLGRVDVSTAFGEGFAFGSGMRGWR